MTDPASPPPEGGGPLEWFRGEVEQWQHERLIRPEQAQALLARYGLLPGETPRTVHHSRIIYLLAALGAVLVGVGVILLVGSNWESLPKYLRLGLLIVATLAAYHGGYALAYRRKTYPKVGVALLLLGSFLWGASIFLVGQMYHMSGPGEGGEKQATLAWALGVLPLAYALVSPLHMLLAVVIGSVWFGMALADYADRGPQAFMLLYLGAGVLVYALGRLQAGWRSTERLETPWRWLGLLYVFAVLYAFSFRDFWSTCSGATGAPHWLWPGAVLAAAAAGVILFLVTHALRDRTSFLEGVALLGLLLIGVVVAAQHPTFFATSGDYDYSRWTQGAYEAMALGNLLLFAAVIGVIALGWARNQPGLVTFGLFAFFVQVVTRYFDLLGSMLSGGLVFVGAGLLLLGAGWALEYSRRKLIGAMTERRAT